MAILPDESTLQRLDLNLLPVFVALMRHRSVTRAGQALFLSQPATSAALARLRAVLRDELFVRRGRTLEPTARAESLMRELEPGLAAIAGALAGATPFDPATDHRVFRIGWSDDAALLGMRLFERLRERAPFCRLVVHRTDWTTVSGKLDRDEIGTAVGFMPDNLPASARLRTLRRGGFCVLRDAATPPVSDLDSYCARPHVLITADGSLTGFMDEALAELGRSRRVVLGLPNFGLLGKVVRGTDLLCTVSEMLAGVLVAEGGLAADPPPVPTREARIRMAWRAALDHDPAEAWLREQIVDVITS